jgi:hypothetical protein
MKGDKTYHIETLSNGSFNFFTTAKNHKEALSNLINKSSDFRNLVSEKMDMVIKIKLIK